MRTIGNSLRFRAGVSLAFGLTWTSAALGEHDVTLAAPVDYATGVSSKSIAVGDLNGDQVPDLVTNRVSVLLGVGDGTFGAPVIHDAGGTGIAIGDLNGDEVPDVAVANKQSETVSVLLGVGDGTFAAAVHYVVDHRANDVAIGDLDGDQVLDLAVANSPQQTGVSVLSGAGCGTFGSAVHFRANSGVVGVAMGDLDGDQTPDLAVVGTHSVSVLLNQFLGACCLGIDCSIETESDCLDSDGTFIGHNTTCDDTIIDTDQDGVRDECDPCPFNNSDDTDGDGVCDSSDACPGGDDGIDSDGDGVADDCDACDNNVPGDCDFVSPILAAAPHDILKNRYISIDPRGEKGFNLGDVPFDIRVRMSSTLVNGVTAVGVSWWANAPDAGCISVVGPTQPVTPPNWSACPTLHLTGCPIIPTSTYEIVAVSGGLQSGPPIVADTQAKPCENKWWGDSVGFFTGTEWTGPQGVTNFDDVNAGLVTFKDSGGVNATHVSVTDIHPNRPDLGGTSVHPNKLVSIDDVFSFIKAFQGDEYPGFALNGCTDP